MHITVLSVGLCAAAVILYHGQSAAPHTPSSSMPLDSVTSTSCFNTVDDMIAPVIVAVRKQSQLLTLHQISAKLLKFHTGWRMSNVY